MQKENLKEKEGSQAGQTEKTGSSDELKRDIKEIVGSFRREILHTTLGKVTMKRQNSCFYTMY